MSRRTAGLLLALVFAAALAASGNFHLYFRDNFSTHYPAKVLSAAILRSGEIPWWNFFVAGGQPLAGNPNYLTFYPTTLLYLVLPAHVAFNLHFYLHLIFGFIALRGLAVQFGASPRSGSIAASSYVLGGAAISTLCFYNLSPAIALMPASVLALELFFRDPRMRTAIPLGAACGLLGTAGEPVTVAGTALLLAIIAAGRVRRNHLLPLLFATALAAVIALPQILAYSEISSEVERGFKPYSSKTVLTASLRPQRLVELAAGPFLGLVTDAGPGGYKVHEGEWPLFLPTVVIGPLFLLALLQPAAAHAVRLKVAIGALLFLAVGQANPIVRAVVSNIDWIRILRYPEKLVLPMSVAAALLIALLLDQPLSRVASAVGAIVIAAGAGIAALTIGDAAPGTLMRLLAGTIVVLSALAFASINWRRSMLVAHFALLGFWMVRTVPIDFSRYYTDRPALADLVAGRLHTPSADIVIGSDMRRHYRLSAEALDPVSGVAHGVSYSSGRSPEGMHAWLSAIINERLTLAPVSLRMRYLSMLATTTVFSPEPLGEPMLEPVAGGSRGGRPLFIYRLKQPLPLIQPIRETSAASSIAEALSLIERGDFDPLTKTIVPRSNRPVPAGDAVTSRLQARPQSISFVTQSTQPSSVLVNQSYFAAWKATADGKPLRMFPANIDRLGIVVPPGQHVVTLEFGRRRSFVAASWLLSLALMVAAVFAAMRSRKSVAAPAK